MLGRLMKVIITRPLGLGRPLFLLAIQPRRPSASRCRFRSAAAALARPRTDIAGRGCRSCSSVCGDSARPGPRRRSAQAGRPGPHIPKPHFCCPGHFFRGPAASHHTHRHSHFRARCSCPGSGSDSGCGRGAAEGLHPAWLGAHCSPGCSMARARAPARRARRPRSSPSRHSPDAHPRPAFRSWSS